MRVADPSRCADCGAPIVWARTVNGGEIRVDHLPSIEGTLRLFKNRNGIIAAQVVTVGSEPELHRPHFKTCIRGR